MPLRYVAYLSLFILNLSYLSCSDAPLGPTDSKWSIKATFPDEWFLPECIACSQNGSVYVVGRNPVTDRNNVIYRYDGYLLTEDFVSPYEGSDFYGIDFFNDTGYAVGHKPGGPYMVRYDGSGWSEVNINDSEIASFRKVFAINDSDCWLVADTYSSVDGVPVKYAGTVFSVYNDFAYVTKAFYYRNEDILYCLNGSGSGSVPEIIITADGGNSWIEEEIKLDCTTYEIGNPPRRSLYGVNGALYFNASVKTREVSDDSDYGGIIKRAGPPGAGKYEIVFISPEAPYFSDVRALAFKDEKHGLAVGHETSVLYEDSYWLLETYRDDYAINTFEGITACPDGYWAFAYYAGPPSEYRLFYHP
jgi:hypothetical protein